LIFSKLVDDVRLKESEYNYLGHKQDCKLLVQCKLVNKNWKYWLDRTMIGKEMRRGFVELE
jgi:hypothetical protein